MNMEQSGLINSSFANDGELTMNSYDDAGDSQADAMKASTVTLGDMSKVKDELTATTDVANELEIKRSDSKKSGCSVSNSLKSGNSLNSGKSFNSNMRKDEHARFIAGATKLRPNADRNDKQDMGVDLEEIDLADNCQTHPQQKADESNANTVTLRKNKATFCVQDNETFDNDYRYMDYLAEGTNNTSRKVINIGSETSISDDDLRLAATLVHDAMEGRTVDFKTEPKYVKSYDLFKAYHLTILLYITLIIDLSLVLFEEPAVEGLKLSYEVTTSIEVVCLVYFIFRTLHHLHWRSTRRFFKDLKNIIIMTIIVVTVVDIIVYVAMKGTDPDQYCLRVSRPLRALLIVNFSDGRQIRRAWRNMRRTMSEIAHVIVLFFFFILVFALIAHRIFRSRQDMVYPDGKPYFKSYLDGVWDLYVLITTSNSPDVMLPAVNKNKFYCIFFFIYVLVCFYMLLNVFLAVAYHSYNSNLKEEIKRSSREKKRKLGQAFDVIKVNYQGEDMVTYKTWKRLMRLAQPRLSKNQIDLLMLILDMDGSGHIGKREFMNVADLLNVPISEVGDRTTWFEKKLPRIYNSVPAEYIKTFVESLGFVILYDVIVVVDILLIAVDVVGASYVFSALFALEILLKIFTQGVLKYVKKLKNWFDILITGSSIIISILIHSTTTHDHSLQEVVEAMAIVRIFRTLRLLVHIKRFKIIADTLVNIAMSILMYCGILFIIFYIFAILGMELFKGKIHNYGYENVNDTSKQFCGAPELENSEFYDSRYCFFNFNDFVSANLMLSSILFENNWDILTEGFTLVSGVKAQVYFGSFYLCVSVVVMNIITAFVVDMFMYEYTIQKTGKPDSIVEKKIKELGLGIDDETGLEISAPLSDNEMRELMKESAIPQPRLHPWVEKATLRRLRNADIRLSRISTMVQKRKSSMPTLNRFDGIRFHIKKRGWTKIEVLLQQLYDVETENDATNALSDSRQHHGQARVV